MRAYLIDPEKLDVSEVDHTGELPSAYALLQCSAIDAVGMAGNLACYVDDFGLDDTDRRPFTVWTPNGWHPDPLFGRGLIIGTDRQGNDAPAGISLEQARAFVRFLHVVAAAARP